MNILGLIPEKSESKGLKNKNLELLLGKPVIDHTIIIAKKLKIKDNRKIKDLISKNQELTK